MLPIDDVFTTQQPDRQLNFLVRGVTIGAEGLRPRRVRGIYRWRGQSEDATK